MRFLIALVLITSACSKKKTETAANPCDAAVERGVDQTIAKRRAGNTQPMTPEEQEVPKKLKAALAKSCADTKWAADVIECYNTADDIAACKDKLTPEQRAAYTQAAMGVMAGARGSAGPHGMGGPPGGSMGGPPGGGHMGGPPGGGSMGAPAGSGDAPAGSAAPPTPPAPAGSGSN
jgi:hypothetical protein